MISWNQVSQLTCGSVALGFPRTLKSSWLEKNTLSIKGASTSDTKGGGGGLWQMNMTLIFEISIARAQKDINSMQCSEVVLSLRRGQKGVPGSTPSVRKVSFFRGHLRRCPLTK